MHMLSRVRNNKVKHKAAIYATLMGNSLEVYQVRSEIEQIEALMW